MLFIECLLCTKPWAQHFPPVHSFWSLLFLATAIPSPWEEEIKSYPPSAQNPTSPQPHPHTFQHLSYFSPLTHSSPPTLASLLLLGQRKHDPTSGPLHLLFPVPQISPWLSPTSFRSLLKYSLLSLRPFLTSVVKCNITHTHQHSFSPSSSFFLYQSLYFFIAVFYLNFILFI